MAAKLKILHSEPIELGTDWFALSMVVGVHLSALVGLYMFPSPSRQVLVATAFMYFLSGFGITAGYHRLWSHGGYNAHWLMRLPLAIGGTCALQGSIIWWSALHRLHHKFGDMPCDPYGPQRGFWFSHCLWIFSPRHFPQLKLIDVSDLRRDPICYWQHRLYKYIAIPLAYGIPLLLARDDWLQTTLWAGAMARVLVWHTTWSVNSVAHWLGNDSFNADHTAKDHLITAFLTLGEGLHSAHHSFPTDWRNGFRWYHYDPTKWLISVAHRLGLAYNLQTTPLATIEKARFLVDEVKLERRRQQLDWPSDPASLPSMTVEKYLAAARKPGATLLALHGFVLDVAPFADQHPGGSKVLRAYCGKSPEVVERAFSTLHPHTSLALHLAEMIRVARLVGESE